jgi:hypothetical protein
MKDFIYYCHERERKRSRRKTMRASPRERKRIQEDIQVTIAVNFGGEIHLNSSLVSFTRNNCQ